MTRAEFAKHRGVSKAAVTQWADAGRIVVDATGKVLVEPSETRLAETMNSRGGKRQKGATGGVQQTPGVAQPPQSDMPFDVSGSGTLTGARTAQATAKAKLDQLEYEQRVGALVVRALYDKALQDGLAPILSRLDSLSTRAAPKLLGEMDVRRIQDVIDDAVLEVRQDIADTLRAMAASGEATKQ